ncbi:S-ribosylhomocysteine lyase [Fundicoccus ignavus]|uniref:S-ribosylhomocysteine lyase n=1 Tax=Fundicoccus ignavus TaxID=2664442 RepID=A0A6I2GCN2_9LACT|nr:S-ribosylhomocysteine lyase [Fundicoccus ignavus]MRI82093.1 S-ribosylhomocysteine lyase [Fundicoccus ignavus]MRI85540.1 S-ribosylhomocysteine lyase [Fundicoccus ignavus]MRJ46700.1 S-ribosylhomocysteine lyase [Fundicoccus ignavus]
MAKVESFSLDHDIVKAPYVRLAGKEQHQTGAVIQKYDLRFLQPNKEALTTAAVHTLEHFLAIHMRDELEGLIDISPMGCRTGFYLVIWDEHTPAEIAQALKNVLNIVLEADTIEATTATECGNYKDHSLFSAKEYAKQVLADGISIDAFERVVI